MIASYSPGDSPTLHQERALRLASILTQARWTTFGNPEYLEDTIFRHRALLNMVSLEDPRHLVYTEDLLRLEKNRFDDFGVTVGCHRVFSSNSKVVDFPSFLDLATSLDVVKSLAMTKQVQDQHLRALISMNRTTTNIAVIEGAIQYCRLVLASPHLKHPLTFLSAIRLGDLLLPNAEYLNESIAVHRSILKTPHRKDFDELMHLYPLAINDSYTKIPDRFQTLVE
ncbi:hypothetical protein BJV74DRAFT_883917 [Russula compacta]|nr:hypothetical protein BJV74DRAFT_883917 [Russula compacta]